MIKIFTKLISNQLASLLIFISLSLANTTFANTKTALVFQSDFSVLDGAVSAMHAVAFSTSSEIAIFDITHEIETFNIWEASYRLAQVANYWPKGTVFVSVVDPGVGTDRKSVVLRTKSGHYFVTPDNGTLTLVAEILGIDGVREIDENKNRLPYSGASHTFHGRDVYAYTGARLAANLISFEEVGALIKNEEIVIIPHENSYVKDGTIYGNIPILDVRYGNIWTSISRKELENNIGAKIGDSLKIEIMQKTENSSKNNIPIYSATIPYLKTFGDTKIGQPLMYVNSLDNISFALNQENFAAKYNIKSGPKWKVIIKKVDNKSSKKS